MKNTVSFIYMGLRVLPHAPLARIAQRKGLIAPDQELLEPVYFLEPGIDRDWLEATLREGFFEFRNCVFPPDLLDSSLQFLHKLGHSGFMLDMVIPGNEKGKGRRKRHGRK